MTDEELIARLREGATWDDDIAAADRIAALVKERDDAWKVAHAATDRGMKAEARAEQLAATNERLEAAMREIAAEASVPVRTWKNGINFKKMYEGWRKIAVERIDIARFALKGEDHE